MFSAAVLALLLRGKQVLADGAECNSDKGTLDFILVEGDANLVSIEDDIRAQLGEVGLKVQSRLLSKEEFNEAHQTGDFHLSFSETWGSPYDPHSYASGWISGDEGHYQAFSSFDNPSSRDELFEKIERVLQEEDHKRRATQWEEIHNYYHRQATMLPLWGKRVPTVMNKRLTGYEMGNQQFDYPVHKLVLLTGPRNVTISPGAQTGLFQSVGRLDPHTYRPNEFFSNNWVYESLVRYGSEGQVLPALAKSWSITDTPNGGQEYTFTLRENVYFHDGQPWNCEAAKMNFDHVLAKPLTTPDWHGWYGLPKIISEWTCDGDMEFRVKTISKYYPFLQEMTFIRPLRMLSPGAFAFGNTTDPITANSCHVGWGEISLEGEVVTCAGISAISGTGPFAFSSRSTSTTKDGDEVDDEVTFVGNKNYWAGAPSIETLKIVRYESSEDVKVALMDGSLDIVWGSGVLQAQDLDDLEDEKDLSIFHSGVIQNVIMLLNTGKAPLDDIVVRKTIIHAIDKKAIIDKELGNVQRPVDTVFPFDSPYCDVDLTPRWDYDIEKALLLSCASSEIAPSKSKDDNSLAVGLGLGLGLVSIVCVSVAFFYYGESKKYEVELERAKKGVQA